MRPTLPERIASMPVVAVFRAPSADRFLDASHALVGAGITCLEFTLTSEGAMQALTKARAALPSHVLIGAGTVRTETNVHEAADAGADFLVSQVYDPSVLQAAHERGVAFIPGALTPTEIANAWAAGVDAVKVSPIGPLGGPRYLKEIAAPMPEVPLMPTGGVELADVPTYLATGAAAVGVSGWLFHDALTAGGSLAELAARASGLVTAVSQRHP